MSDKSTPAVLQMSSHKTNSQSRTEIESARSCLSMLSWEMQVQQVVALCGLNLTRALLDGEAQTMSGSHASNMGHTTIKSLVESKASNSGLELSWKEFHPKLTARIYRDMFALSEKNAEEINLQVEDVKSEIGRMPHDASEFHDAKQKMLLKKIERIENEHRQSATSLREKQRELIAEVNRLTEENKHTSLKTAEVMKESASKIQEAYRDAARKIEESESLIESKKDEIRKELEKEHQHKLSELNMEKQKKIDSLLASEETLKKDLHKIQMQITAGDLVGKDAIEGLKEELRQSRDEATRLRGLDEESKQRLMEARTQVDDVVNSKNQLMARLSEAEAQNEELEVRLKETMEGRMNGSEFAIYQERISHMREKAADLTNQVGAMSLLLSKAEKERDEARGRYQELKSDGQAYVGRLQEEIAEYRGKYANVKLEMGEKLKAMGIKVKKSEAMTSSLNRAVIALSLVIVVGGLITLL